MFEQHASQPQPPTSNKPTEDMFASTDPVKNPNASSSHTPMSTQPSNSTVAAPQPSMPVSPSSRRKNIILFLIVIILVGIAVGAMAYYFTRSSVSLPEAVTPESPNAIETGQEQQSINESPQTGDGMNSDIPISDIPQVPALTPQEPEQPIPVAIDQDHDGLSQEEETRVGSSDNLADTDLDGLTDWQEVRIYKSSPVSADTDSDGYIDGHEVQNGYSPTGSGKLLDVPQQ